MLSKVLWIEDSARLELANLTGPIYFGGTCDLTLAEDVTTASRLLLAKRYDAVVVDVRLPPGHDERWRSQYQMAGASKITAQLGLKLLAWLLRSDKSIFEVEPPDWISPQYIAVFTVETRHEIHETLDELGISLFQEKTANLSDDALDQLIRAVLAKTNGQGARA